jgi:hypothetical protein
MVDGFAQVTFIIYNNVFHKKPEKIIFSKVLGVNSSAKKNVYTAIIKQFLTFFSL